MPVLTQLLVGLIVLGSSDGWRSWCDGKVCVEVVLDELTFTSKVIRTRPGSEISHDILAILSVFELASREVQTVDPENVSFCNNDATYFCIACLSSLLSDVLPISLLSEVDELSVSLLLGIEANGWEDDDAVLHPPPG